jgi:hypothetical protein
MIQPPRFPVHRLLFAGLAAALCAAAAAADFPRYTAQRIDLPRVFKPTALNASGELAGYKEVEFTGDDHRLEAALAFRQAAGGKPDVLGDFEGGSRLSMLIDINDAGLAAGYGNVEDLSTPDFYRSGQRAIASTRDGRMLDLAALLPADFASAAVAVNQSGQVIGNYKRGKTAGTKQAPFLWSEQAGMQLPFPMRKDFGYVRFSDINDLGHVAGVYGDRGGDIGVMIWDAERGTLHREMRLGYYRDQVNAINNQDQVVGSDFNEKAFVWRPPAGRAVLPRPFHFGRRQWHCDANDINDGGTIVGFCRGLSPRGEPYYNPLVWVPDAESYAVAELASLIDPPLDDPHQRGGAIAQRIGNDGRILLQTYQQMYKSGPAYLLTPVAAR